MLDKNIFLVTFILFSLLLVSCIEVEKDEEENKVQNKTLTILWAEWKPADYLQELTEDFTEETGIEVKIVQDSWGTWQDLFKQEMAKGEEGMFDMVIGDSQWLGMGAKEDHYIELTDWMEKNDIADKFTEASIKGYSEFPKGSGHYWAIPLEGDAMGFSYRKDLFEDPKEKSDFKEEYGYELDVPETWDQLKDIAEFFYRPEKDLYGVLIWTEPRYDGITMGLEALIWSWGAALGNSQTYQVDGILNSEEGIEALKFYKELNEYNNPEWVNHYLDTDLSSNQPMMDGNVAMAMGYLAINPEILDPEKNPEYHDKVGFFAAPEGPEGRYASLGGQGISIISYKKNKEDALRFLEWFVRDEVQEKWAELGGLTCNKKVLNSEKFLNASPRNRPFVESMNIIRDFWAVPEYTELLKVSQKHWYAYVIEDNITAEQAMDDVAEEWEDIFEYSGYYKE